MVPTSHPLLPEPRLILLRVANWRHMSFKRHGDHWYLITSVWRKNNVPYGTIRSTPKVISRIWFMFCTTRNFQKIPEVYKFIFIFCVHIAIHYHAISWTTKRNICPKNLDGNEMTTFSMWSVIYLFNFDVAILTSFCWNLSRLSLLNRPAVFNRSSCYFLISCHIWLTDNCYLL